MEVPGGPVSRTRRGRHSAVALLSQWHVVKSAFHVLDVLSSAKAGQGMLRDVRELRWPVCGASVLDGLLRV